MLAETKLSPAARADGPLAEGFQTELLDLARLADIQPEWRRLLDGACDPNPFLGPDFFLPLVGHVAGDRLTGVMVLRSDEARGSSELAAFFPYRIASKFPLTSLPVVEAFTHPFTSDGTPLLRRDGVETVAAALVAALAERFPGHILLIDHLRLETTTAVALRASAAARGFPVRLIASHERAALRGGPSSEAYLRERVNGKKLRELRRCEKRLREAGRVEMRTLVGAEAAGGLQEFLRLEASGWKGRRGTALAATARTRAFAEAALAGAGAPSVAIDVLRVDGATIAAAVHLVAGSSAAAFKCAYDEDWGRMSPGALLDLHSLRFALDEGRFALTDSCAVPGHPVETLWRDRVQVGRIAIGLGTPCDGRALDSFARRADGVGVESRRQGAHEAPRPPRDGAAERGLFRESAGLSASGLSPPEDGRTGTAAGPSGFQARPEAEFSFMKTALFTVYCLVLLAAPRAALADERGAAAGAVTGAVAGALVGGPVGAVIGAAVGGVVVGTATSQDALASAEVEPPPPPIQERVLVQRQAQRRGGPATLDPATTGSVVETTCVQDARGNMKCRKEAVR